MKGGFPERAVLLEAPVAEECLGQAVLARDLEVTGRDDLVGIDVLGRERDHAAGEDPEWLRHASATADRGQRLDCRAGVADSATTPAIALARRSGARPGTSDRPLPWRPSKFRLLVLTAYWPGWSWSPFMAMHIEQPASRHSAPAA